MLDRRAESYLAKVNKVVSAMGDYASAVVEGAGKNAMPGPGSCPQLTAAVALEAAFEDLETVTAAPAGLAGCFAQASKLPAAVRAAAQTWVNGSDPKAGIALCFALTDPGVAPKARAATCTTTNVTAACQTDLANLATAVTVPTFTCPH